MLGSLKDRRSEGMTGLNTSFLWVLKVTFESQRGDGR